MNISPTELKTMKSKQLRRMIREAIDTVLKEDYNALVTTKTGTKSISYKNPTELNNLKQDSNVTNITTTTGQKLKEMARVAKGYRLADENLDVTPYINKRISGIALSDFINYFRENPGAEKIDIFNHFNLSRPQIANSVVNGLTDAGILLRLGAGGAVEAPRIPSENDREEEEINGPESMVMGNNENPLAAYFDGLPNEDGTEDFTDEEIPEELPTNPLEPIQVSMNDEDYESFMKYTDLKQRLDSTKSNILKSKRSGGREAGDITDNPNADIDRLIQLKKSLQDRIDILISNSPYLKKRLGQKLPEIEPEIVEPEDDIEDENNIEDKDKIDEYLIRKWQHYAGIK